MKRVALVGISGEICTDVGFFVNAGSWRYRAIPEIGERVGNVQSQLMIRGIALPDRIPEICVGRPIQRLRVPVPVDSTIFVLEPW